MTTPLMPQSHTAPVLLLSHYQELAAKTDRFDARDLKPVLLGLFGEVGSIMSAAKKHHREKEAFAGYRAAVVEEFGDALWYFAALCRRAGHRLDDVMSAATKTPQYQTSVAAGHLTSGPIAEISALIASPQLDEALLDLGAAVATLLNMALQDAGSKQLAVGFAGAYLNALQAAGLPFSEVVQKNIAKAHGRFLPARPDGLPTFDGAFPPDERLPENFEIEIIQRTNGKSSLRWNGVFIGDPLTDNIHDPDGYRFHDVFHFANAAILHWSPTFRALIKHKRKSKPDVDEAQDSGRAIVVEEGLSAWVFSCAKQLKFFEGQTSVSFDMLKIISQFVAGYEAESIPLKLWETAILEGYAVFRQVRDSNGGVVIGDRAKRSVSFRPLSGSVK